MAKQYDTFVDDLATLPEGKEVVLAVRNLEDFKTIAVKAVVSSTGEEGDLLWLRFSRGRLREKPWRIKVIEELPFETLFIESSLLQ
jgi:hypothetical protein